MKRLSAGWIIHLFAFLHVAIVLVCRLSGVEDELILTILTMVMTLLICIKKELNIEFTAASIIVVNIIGYVLGNAGASLFSTFISSQMAIHALASGVTTEILGWSIVAIAKIPHKESASKPITSEYLKWLILAAVTVFVTRLGIMALLNSEVFSDGSLMNAVSRILGSTFSVITLICTNIIFIRSRKLARRFGMIVKIIILIVFTLLSGLLGVLLCSVNISGLSIGSANEFLRLFIAAVIIQAALYCIIYMINYALTARNEMRKERGKANMAQFQYQRLKRQVLPL